MIISWILFTFSVVGATLNIKKSVWGFVFYLIANIGWVIYHIIGAEYASVATFSVFTGLSIWGIIEWRNKKEKNIDNEIFKDIKEDFTLTKPESAWEIYRRLYKINGDFLIDYLETRLTGPGKCKQPGILLLSLPEKNAINILKQVERELKNEQK